ncbi:energy-coupling factor transport system permease protein [Acetitomaculum ruminis DSM 5522]|uniref:Energy-coupling factor transport system permease protein n=1 Tax=Acetitomaculum ruminis DSM 5522 TaxID=1120918 RepID=A0A1I1A6S0_9FIRM|nr:energy-coupling factor transporter transmembrane component T [Acetitomaculum ruminis]SFB32130.1 energy-coupling factor transport system permease protein [Acetitomaculum ruminis DSM 5522]
MITIDPRTKLILIIITVAFSMLIPTGISTCIWILITTFLGILLGRVGKTLKATLLFGILWFVAIYILPEISGTAHTSLLVWLGLVFKCYPCCMLAGIVIGTTKISEFMAAMAKWNVPRSIVIPLAIMFRYFPTLKEDWGHISDAMALRGISLSPVYFLKNPLVVIEALYLPILVTASKTADELSASAITRGVENPKMRTSRLDIRFRMTDGVILFLFLFTFAGIVMFYAGGYV